MDRNLVGAGCLTMIGGVALRKESVDRNAQHLVQFPRRQQSLSARRAWIEMVAACPFSCWGAVALRKESVDRNFHNRVALIPHQQVALRKESVDRNITSETIMVPLFSGRSPQGERG